MINRQLYTMKFNSSRLKKYNYNISIDYSQAMSNGEIVALSDNQLLRTIRKVVINKNKDNKEINKRILDRDLLEDFYQELNKIRVRKHNEKNVETIKEIKSKIIDMCFIPEYITIVMENNKHYDFLFKNGLTINGIKYFRLSTSASQGRVSTVVFCSEDILKAVNEILDNGRNKNIKFSPSKFNAYKGTYGTATKVVTTPRFCVVPDYYSETTFKVNWVTETPENKDDLIEEKEITKSYNRFDGQGLISPKMAEIWAKDLDLDYIPSEFCIRQSFVKGMLCVFDFHEFCKIKNNENYKIKTIYKDEFGNNIEVDLRDIDVIITESQFKLWDSFLNIEQYKTNCEKNELFWGVSLYTDKEIKDVLKMNYQFLQVLNIKDEDIPVLCKDFENWIKGINSENIWYTLLFLLGTHVTKETIRQYMRREGNHWIKALICNHDLINDKYIRQKIYNMVKTKINNGCIGNIILDGNNQTLVSDPYAMMEHICGFKDVKGLLNADEFYSHYWNGKNVKEIVGMRPPLTFRSEVTKLNLVNTYEQQKWYKYLYGGIIVNIHGHETDNWAGSDFDFDFLSTTSNEIVLKSRYENELPVTYQAPSPEKILFTDNDLYIADKFTFGSQIGPITNKSTSGIALLKYFEEIYGIESNQYKTTLNRVKMCTKLQSAQIDKAKIGKNVKGIPLSWIDEKYIDSLKIEDSEKDFLKEIMLSRHPYFFTHLYPKTKKIYKRYTEEQNLSCIHQFGVGIKELMIKSDKTKEEIDYLKHYHKNMPVIDSNSVMNNISKHIENIDFGIKKIIKNTPNKDIHLILMRNNNIVNEEMYDSVLKEYRRFKKEISTLKSISEVEKRNKFDESQSQSIKGVYVQFKDNMESICSNVSELVDYLIYIFYHECKGDNKDLLWNTYGDVILKTLKDKKEDKVLFPIPCSIDEEEYHLTYLNKKYKLQEVEL